MFSPNVLIGIGTVFIALGGFVATNGWNAKATVSERNGLVRAAAAELMVNIAVISDQKFTEQDDAELAKFVIFPRLQPVALEGAIASAAFLGEKDRLLLTRMTQLLELIHEFNNRLSFTEAQMAANTENILRFRKTLRDGATRNGIKSKLKLFGYLLVSDYNIKESDSFYVKLDEDAV